MPTVGGLSSRARSARLPLPCSTSSKSCGWSGRTSQANEATRLDPGGHLWPPGRGEADNGEGAGRRPSPDHLVDRGVMDTVGVVCAMDSEAVHLRRRLADAHERPIGRCRRTRGQVGATPVDLVVSGIGLINAAAATSALCALDPPAVLLNYGCAGA